MLEFAPRIAPSIFTDPTANPVFATCPGGSRTLAEAPVWLRDLLGWHGVTPDRVRIIDRPVEFESLNVVPQPERAGFDNPPPPQENYLDALTDRALSNLGEVPPKGTLFVSRSGVCNELVGEACLDEAFAAAGTHRGTSQGAHTPPHRPRDSAVELRDAGISCAETTLSEAASGLGRRCRSEPKLPATGSSAWRSADLHQGRIRNLIQASLGTAAFIRTRKPAYSAPYQWRSQGDLRT